MFRHQWVSTAHNITTLDAQLPLGPADPAGSLVEPLRISLRTTASLRRRRTYTSVCARGSRHSVLPPTSPSPRSVHAVATAYPQRPSHSSSSSPAEVSGSWCDCNPPTSRHMLISLHKCCACLATSPWVRCSLLRCRTKGASSTTQGRVSKRRSSLSSVQKIWT